MADSEGGTKVVLTELVRELKALRRGRGVFASRIDERVGPSLRTICDITDNDGPAVIRQKVTKRLEELAADLPADLHVTVLAAFAIYGDARLPLYQDRVSWAATRLDRDPRTARRRIDEAINHVAQLATVHTATRPDPQPTMAENGWHTVELRVMLALDGDRPEAMEQRRIVCDQDGLTELDLAVTLPVPAEARQLEARIFYGGDTLIDRGMESRERRAFALTLPRPLARGESHDFAVLFRLPKDQPMRPYLVCVPKRPCDVFDLRIRFDRARAPAEIGLLRGAFQRDAADPTWPGETQPTDQASELHLTFHHLTPGLAYGARWEQTPADHRAAR